MSPVRHLGPPTGEPPPPAPMPAAPDEGEQLGLLGSDEEFHRAWSEYRGMPEFRQEDLEPYSSVLVHFATREDQLAFEALVGQKVGGGGRRRSNFMWYPEAAIGSYADKRYRAVERPTGLGEEFG